MPKAAKSTAANKPEVDDLSFEEALSRLEAIVEAMEAGDLPLEALMAKFEEGTRLARACQTRLADAELRIQQLEKNAAGELELKSIALPGDNPAP